MDAKRRIFRSGTAGGAHIRALHAALVELEELLPAAPSAKRVALRNHRAALVRAHPELLKVNEVDLEHDNQEDDDEIVTTV